MVPYWLAHRLGLRLVPAIAGLTMASGEAAMVQAVPGGRRRQLFCPLPLLATVGSRAPGPRLSAFARARRGVLYAAPARGEPDARQDWAARPARARPTRAMQGASGSASERLRAGRGDTGSGKRGGDETTLANIDPENAADRILGYLREEGLLGR